MKVNVNFVVSILNAIYHTTNEYDENWEDLSNGILNQLFANRDEVSTWGNERLPADGVFA